MEEALRNMLLGTAALAQRVGTRVDWNARSQGGSLPAIVLQQISARSSMTMAGPDGWSQDRVQIDCWARTHKQARDMGNILGGGPGVSGVLDGFRGTVDGLRLRTFIINRRSDTDKDDEGITHRTSVDVLVWYAA